MGWENARRGTAVAPPNRISAPVGSGSLAGKVCIDFIELLKGAATQ
jgi:hypothetical protein